TGFLAGVGMARQAIGSGWESPPRATALGSLVHFITHADPENYQPTNISFDLLPPLENAPRNILRDRRARRELQCERALDQINAWISYMVQPPLSGRASAGSEAGVANRSEPAAAAWPAGS
ncbi:MAG TPA: hypothetical protein VKW70_04635, partial [Terriglobia bacterium]|nr:hypothetical protein [Terriglobia bacterium]